MKEEMDRVFRFKINDIVQSKLAPKYEKKPSWSGTHHSEKEKVKRSWLSFDFRSAPIKYVVVERIAQQCHGGIQLHYQVRLMNDKGLIERTLLQITEFELELSGPYEQPLSMTKEEAQKYVDNM